MAERRAMLTLLRETTARTAAEYVCACGVSGNVIPLSRNDNDYQDAKRGAFLNKRAGQQEKQT